MSWQDAAFKMRIYSLKNIHAQENDQLLWKHRYLITENIKCGFFFQWQSYHNNVIILRNWILISYSITQEDKYGIQLSLVLFIRGSVNIFIFHILQDSGYTWIYTYIYILLSSGLLSEKFWLLIFYIKVWLNLWGAALPHTAKGDRSQCWITEVKTFYTRVL